MSEISRYFTGANAPSVFDTIPTGGPLADSELKVDVVSAQETDTITVPDSIRDIWLRGEDSGNAVTMLTSPGILSTNDLVGLSWSRFVFLC